MPIRFAYHPATFVRVQKPLTREKILAACETLAGMGWRGIELSYGEVAPLWPNAADYRRDLQNCGVQPVTLYVWNTLTDRTKQEAEIERSRKAFAYLAAGGGEFALIDGGVHAEGANLDEEVALVAEGANQLGKAAQETGTRAVWHQHFGSVIEFTPQFHRFMELTDPKLVGFCPDTAQLTLGAIDCEDTFRRYIGRIQYVHFKDLDAKRRMRELGGGLVSFEPLRDILVKGKYSGWIQVDLDYVTDMTAEEAARRCVKRLGELFGEREV